MNTRVSVAMATYNGSKYIIEQLESIRSQSRKVDEVIIVDDGSTDDTENIIISYINKHRLDNWFFSKNETNLGYARNFVKAIKSTTGDVVFLCDQDDVWLENKVEEMLKFFNENDSLWMLHSEINLIDSQGRLLSEKYQKLQKGYRVLSVKDYIKRLNYCGMSSAFSYKLRDALSSFDLNSIPTHDWILGMIAAVYGQFATVDKVFTNRRKHDNNAALIENKSRYSKEERIAYISTYNEFYESYLTAVSVNDSPSSVKRQIENMIKLNDMRIDFLRRKSILGMVSLLPKVGLYPSFKAYISDYRYLLR